MNFQLGMVQKPGPSMKIGTKFTSYWFPDIFIGKNYGRSVIWEAFFPPPVVFKKKENQLIVLSIYILYSSPWIIRGVIESIPRGIEEWKKVWDLEGRGIPRAIPNLICEILKCNKTVPNFFRSLVRKVCIISNSSWIIQILKGLYSTILSAYKTIYFFKRPPYLLLKT